MTGFLGKLCDLNFKEFVTPGLIRFLYLLAMVVIGLTALVSIVGGFALGFAGGLATLVITLLSSLLGVILARVSLEMFMETGIQFASGIAAVKCFLPCHSTPSPLDYVISFSDDIICF